jgi:hypothetical protein
MYFFKKGISYVFCILVSLQYTKTLRSNNSQNTDISTNSTTRLQEIILGQTTRHSRKRGRIVALECGSRRM